MASQTPPLQQQPLEAGTRRRKELLQALAVYGTIMGLFLTIIIIAVTTTMRMEREKPGFRAIEVSQPINFWDKTYLKEEKKPR